MGLRDVVACCRRIRIEREAGEWGLALRPRRRRLTGGAAQVDGMPCQTEFVIELEPLPDAEPGADGDETVEEG